MFNVEFPNRRKEEDHREGSEGRHAEGLRDNGDRVSWRRDPLWRPQKEAAERGRFVNLSVIYNLSNVSCVNDIKPF